MGPILPKILLSLALVLIVGNLIFIDYSWYKNQKQPVKTEIIEKNIFPTPVDVCGPVCQQTIDEKVVSEVAKITPIPTYTNTQSKVNYIPLVTGGSASSASWTEVIPSEFYFDLTSYPGAKEVRFEAYLLSINNDKAYARLYDQTNKRGVDVSDLETISSSFVRVESSPIVLWRGNNKYTVQLRTVNGTQVQIKEAKLKILF